jgi:para-aminobenzoate synthetase/4-amino-4-deoxychorismate lyase
MRAVTEAHARFDLGGAALAFRGPRAALAPERLAGVRPAVRAAEAAWREGRWVALWIAYEAAPAFDPALRARAPAPGPLATFLVFDGPAAAPLPAGEAALGPLAPEWDEAAHRAAVEEIRAALGRGDAYQVNLTFRLRGRFEGDPLALHERLRRAQGGRGLAATIVHGGRAVVSASPELFLEVDGDRVVSRPMKGTAPRGRFAAEDDALAAALATSEKDRAENVMIADLVRNDLGRVAVPGSVIAGPVCEVEPLRTVHQMTSTVTARLRPGAGLEDLLAAAFPAGSITGAPKAKATEIVAALEASPRGVYCGAVGLLAPGGRATLQVAIRTLALDLAAGEATYGAGGGITWGSDAAAEWREALAKTRVLEPPPPPFRLVETLRLDGGRYPLLERHLERLGRSARLLDFALDPAAARAALLARAGGAPDPGRVRLLLAEDGALEVEAGPLPPTPAHPEVALAGDPVSRSDRFLFHKTTRREVYAARRAERPGLFDVLLRNDEGELTEFTIGNLVLERGGRRYTPPVACGLLGGVMREELLATGALEERVLRPEDLARADRVLLVNAVRGVVPVRVVP